jgi:hypothetical protein
MGSPQEETPGIPEILEGDLGEEGSPALNGEEAEGKKPKKAKVEADDAKTLKDKLVHIPAFNMVMYHFTIEGHKDVAYHSSSMGDESGALMKELERLAQGLPKPKKVVRDLDLEYETAIHRTLDGRPGIPSQAIYKAIIGACRFVAGIYMTQASGLFQIQGADASGVIPILGAKPEQKRLIVNDRKGQAHLVVCASYVNWSANFTAKWDKSLMTVETFLNLLARGGFHVGIGRKRPEKFGQNGTFRATTFNQLEVEQA